MALGAFVACNKNGGNNPSYPGGGGSGSLCTCTFTYQGTPFVDPDQYDPSDFGLGSCSALANAFQQESVKQGTPMTVSCR